MEINRSRRPQPRGKISFSLPEVEEFSLANGLNVLYVRKTNLPVMQFTIVADAGSRMDPFEKKGISNLLSALLDEGAGGLDSLQLSDAFESIGASLSVFSDPDSFFVSMLTLTENLETALDLLSKVVTRPHLDEADFEREKRKIKTRVLQLKDDASYLSTVVFEEIVFGRTNPYGLTDTGTIETIERIELQDVKTFYNTLFTASNSRLIIVGDTEKEIIREKLNNYFSGWHDYTPPVFEMTIPESSGSRIYIVDKPDAAQCEIRLGHISTGRNTPGFYARTVMNNILGGQFSSRININLREDKGYTYGASSSFSYNRVCGYFAAGAAVKTEETSNAVMEIIRELNGIREYVTEKELRFAKSSIIRKFPSLFETYSQIGRNLANRVIHNLPDTYFNDYIDNIKSVTLEDVYEAAKTNILPDRLTILAVGDKSKILPGLEGLGMGPVTELDSDGNIVK